MRREWKSLARHTRDVASANCDGRTEGVGSVGSEIGVVPGGGGENPTARSFNLYLCTI